MGCETDKRDVLFLADVKPHPKPAHPFTIPGTISSRSIMTPTTPFPKPWENSRLIEEPVSEAVANPTAQTAPTTSAAPGSAARWTRGVWITALVYAAIRIALIPSAGDVTNSFSHDGAYNLIVARNLLAGRGLVNDAHWLVFLNPASLPIPFHNANPLYPLSIAGFSWLTHAPPWYSALLISALSSVFLLVGLWQLLIPITKAPAWSLAMAWTAVLWPSVFEISCAIAPDGLTLTLAVWAVVAIRSAAPLRATISGGLLLGAAWLTRSSAILLVPALALYSALRFPFRHAALRMGALLAVFVIVVSPWLWYTKKVWGNPLRSDAGYYLFAQLEVNERFPGAELKFYHSPVLPRPLGERLREPGTLVKSVVNGMMKVVWRMGGEWSMHEWEWAIALMILVAPLGLERKVWRRPETWGVLAYGATALGAFSIRGESIEPRYLSLVSVLVAMLAVRGLLSLPSGVPRAGRLGRMMLGTKAVVAASFGIAILYDCWRTFTFRAAVNPETAAYAALARTVDSAYAKGRPVVVGDAPYFYTYATGAPSLSFPEASDAYLLQYMDRYHAPLVLLTAHELGYWRPAWQSTAGLPDGLWLVHEAEDARVYERTRQP